MKPANLGLRARAVVLLRSPILWGVVATILLLAINVAKDPTYLAITVNPQNGNLVGNLVDIIRAAAPILMIAVGMCLVIATGGIDLSVGSIMCVAGAVSMEFLKNASGTLGDALIAIVLALALSLALGAINGIMVAVVGLQPFISTLVMMLAGRGVAKVITSGQNTSANNDSFSWIANGFLVGLPVVFLLAIVITIIVGFVVRRSALGLMIEAIGIDPKASRLAGLNRKALLLTAYSASGLLAGIAGIFATASVMTVDISRTGYQLELDAILAVVIGGGSLMGGRFNLLLSVIGALIIQGMNTGILLSGFQPELNQVVKAVVVLCVLIVQSPRFVSIIKGIRGHDKT